MGDLDGRVAIISGGLGDIARAIALELAGRGADIALGDLAAQADDEVLAPLRATGRRVRYDQVDVADSAAVDRWLAAVGADLGVADLVIANAAVAGSASIREISAEDWDRELAVNLNGVFHLSRGGAERLVAAGKPGRVVVIGSWAAHAPHPRIPAYSVAKAGVRMLAQCLALEYAADDILVNEVAPGFVDAGLTGRRFRDDPALKEAAREAVPVNRLLDAADVAWCVAMLCDPRNRHMTGTVVLADGGLSLMPFR